MHLSVRKTYRVTLFLKNVSALKKIPRTHMEMSRAFNIMLLSRIEKDMQAQRNKRKACLHEIWATICKPFPQKTWHHHDSDVTFSERRRAVRLWRGSRAFDYLLQSGSQRGLLWKGHHDSIGFIAVQMTRERLNDGVHRCRSEIQEINYEP